VAYLCIVHGISNTFPLQTSLTGPNCQTAWRGHTVCRAPDIYRLAGLNRNSRNERACQQHSISRIGTARHQHRNSQTEAACQQHKNSRTETACQRRSISRRRVARKQYSKRELAEWSSTWRDTGTHEMRGSIKENKESTNWQGMWHNTETHGMEHHMKKSVGTYRNEHNTNSRTGITKNFAERDDTRNNKLVLNNRRGHVEQRKTDGTKRHIKQHRSCRNGKNICLLLGKQKFMEWNDAW